MTTTQSSSLPLPELARAAALPETPLGHILPVQLGLAAIAAAAAVAGSTPPSFVAEEAALVAGVALAGRTVVFAGRAEAVNIAVVVVAAAIEADKAADAAAVEAVDGTSLG